MSTNLSGIYLPNVVGLLNKLLLARKKNMKKKKIGGGEKRKENLLNPTQNNPLRSVWVGSCSVFVKTEPNLT